MNTYKALKAQTLLLAVFLCNILQAADPSKHMRMSANPVKMHEQSNVTEKLLSLRLNFESDGELDIISQHNMFVAHHKKQRLFEALLESDEDSDEGDSDTKQDLLGALLEDDESSIDASNAEFEVSSVLDDSEDERDLIKEIPSNIYEDLPPLQEVASSRQKAVHCGVCHASYKQLPRHYQTKKHKRNVRAFEGLPPALGIDSDVSKARGSLMIYIGKKIVARVIARQ